MTDPIAISLLLHPGDAPGWRVHLHPGGGEFPIDIKQAEEIARVMGDMLPPTAEPTAFELIRKGTTELRQTLATRLANAEREAASIAGLRRALAEVGEQ